MRLLTTQPICRLFVQTLYFQSDTDHIRATFSPSVLVIYPHRSSLAPEESSFTKSGNKKNDKDILIALVHPLLGEGES